MCRQIVEKEKIRKLKQYFLCIIYKADNHNLDLCCIYCKILTNMSSILTHPKNLVSDHE